MLCGGGAGPLSSVWSPLPFGCGNAPGACCGAGVDSCMGSLISSLGLAMFADLRALNRRNSSGGKLRGCELRESEDLLRKANEELARGLLGVFSFSRWSRSRTKEVRLFFSGDDCADLALCASAESVDGLGRGDGGASLGACGGVEDFLRVKIGIGSKKTNCRAGKGLWMRVNGWYG
jgi:hypothetical protein